MPTNGDGNNGMYGNNQDSYGNFGGATEGGAWHQTQGYDYNPYGGPSEKNAAMNAYIGGAKQSAINSGQFRPVYAHELYGTPNYAQQYGEAATAMSQARLAQGMNMANASMASQAVGRGSSPLAQRGAIAQGGQNALQAGNMAAQLQQQGMMGASQLGIQERQQRLGALDSMKQQQMQKYGIDKAAAHAKEQLNHQKNQDAIGTFGTVLGTAAGTAGAMMTGSDIRMKQDVQPMSPGTAPMTSIGTPMSGNEPDMGLRQYYLGPEGGPLEGLPSEFTTPDRQGAPVMEGYGQSLYGDPSAQNRAGGAMSTAGQGMMALSDPEAKRDAYALGHRIGAERAYMRMNDTPPDQRDALHQDAMAERAGRLGAELEAAPKPAWTREGQHEGLHERSPIDDSLRAMKPYAFRYKPEAAQAFGQDTGMRAGTMTSDLKRDPLTAAMVRQTPHGEAIDLPTATGTALAGVGRLAERVDALEGSRGGELLEMPAQTIRADPREVRLRDADRLMREERGRTNPWATNDIGDGDPALIDARNRMRPLNEREQAEWAYRQGRGGM